MHFVRAVGEAQRADMGVGVRQPGVGRHAPAAMRLDRVIDYAQCHARRRHLDHGDLELRRLVAGLVHHVGGLEAEEPRHFDVDARFGDALLPDRMLGDLLAEGDAGQKPLGHLLQRHFGNAYRAHAVVDAAGAKPALRDLETAAFAEQEVLAGTRTSLSKTSAWPCGASS